ncbi:MAG: hypothetical protein KM312_10595 [Hydrogenibacillus schlegelii]|uniref:Uncharacterized protein n=1 Tax=Hydrogenibacillus schlegelii TaxID=1484 RepID=A0A947CWJ4_HYDSH|nr:hypothetical protein [Hydrogenibacillus schlegelii]MBT9282407.1 hypothetical protein [Hydrogenibacillus schlegelii]MBT9283068.1 hypothetical protein [Hydrogenibacillus schlegelii]
MRKAWQPSVRRVGVAGVLWLLFAAAFGLIGCQKSPATSERPEASSGEGIRNEASPKRPPGSSGDSDGTTDRSSAAPGAVGGNAGAPGGNEAARPPERSDHAAGVQAVVPGIERLFLPGRLLAAPAAPRDGTLVLAVELEGGASAVGLPGVRSGTGAATAADAPAAQMPDDPEERKAAEEPKGGYALFRYRPFAPSVTEAFEPLASLSLEPAAVRPDGGAVVAGAPVCFDRGLALEKASVGAKGVSGLSCSLAFIDVSTGERRPLLEAVAPVFSVVFSPDGGRVAIAHLAGVDVVPIDDPAGARRVYRARGDGGGSIGPFQYIIHVAELAWPVEAVLFGREEASVYASEPSRGGIVRFDLRQSDGAPQTVLDEPVIETAWAVAPDGRTVVASASREIYLMDVGPSSFSVWRAELPADRAAGVRKARLPVPVAPDRLPLVKTFAPDRTTLWGVSLDGRSLPERPPALFRLPHIDSTDRITWFAASGELGEPGTWFGGLWGSGADLFLHAPSSAGDVLYALRPDRLSAFDDR